MASDRRVIVIGMDGSEYSEYAFHCEYLFIVHFILFYFILFCNNRYFEYACFRVRHHAVRNKCLILQTYWYPQHCA